MSPLKKEVPPLLLEAKEEISTQEQNKIENSSDLLNLVKIQKDENNSLRELMQKMQRNIIPANLISNDFLQNDNDISNSNEIIEHWNKKYMIISHFSSLQITNRRINLENDILKKEGIKKIEQEILNESDSVIKIEKVHFDSSSKDFISFFLFYFLLN